jgi:hypothetical protein
MKTNFLYFRENGYQQFTATNAQTNFTINGAANWDVAIGADTDVKVEVTFLEAQAAKVGSNYSSGSVDAGETVVVHNDGKALSTNDIVIDNITDTTYGITLSAGDIVTISRIPAVHTEAVLRSDKLLSVHSNSDTETEVTFVASNGSSADDTVVLTHPDTNGAEFKKIAEYFHDVCGSTNINKRGSAITVWDKQNGVIGKGLSEAGVTNMNVSLA